VGWNALRTSARRRVIAAIGTSTVAVIASLAVAVPPAHAAASGYFLTKGTGSIYSKVGIVNLGVVPGGTAKTFYYKIVNTAATAESFKVNMTPSGTGTWKLYKGTSAVPNEYVTPAIAPGKTLALKVKVTLAAGTPQGEYLASLALRDPVSNVGLDSVLADANATNQTGTKRNDLFLKTGSQPYVGGSFGPQFETANAIKVGNTATFTLRLKNDGTAPAAIGLDDIPTFGCGSGSNFTLTIKQGTQNVTAAVLAGSYNTGTIVPGAKKELKVMVKLVSATTCENIYYGFRASGPDGTIDRYAHTIVGV
jgi:hypothetical protein